MNKKAVVVTMGRDNKYAFKIGKRKKKTVWEVGVDAWLICKGTTVGVVTRLWAGQFRFLIQTKQEISSSPICPGRPWGPPSLLFNLCRSLFARGWSEWGVGLTSYINLMPKLRISGVSTPPPTSPNALMLYTGEPLPSTLGKRAVEVWTAFMYFVTDEPVGYMNCEEFLDAVAVMSSRRLGAMDLVNALGRTHLISMMFPLCGRGTGGEFVSLRQLSNFPCFENVF
jgi:hypothetical protein